MNLWLVAHGPNKLEHWMGTTDTLCWHSGYGEEADSNNESEWRGVKLQTQKKNAAKMCSTYRYTIQTCNANIKILINIANLQCYPIPIIFIYI